MKKSLPVFMILALLLTFLLSACGQKAPATATKTPTPSAVPSSAAPEESTLPSEDAEEEDIADSEEDGANLEEDGADLEDAIFARINASELEFSSEVEDYLSTFGDADHTLQEIEPILVSAAYAAHVNQTFFYIDDDPMDATFAWSTLYYYVNTYEFNDDTVTEEDGAYIIPYDTMADFFMDVFNMDDIPDVPAELAAAITYDETDDAYSVLAAGGEGLSYVVSDITVSLTDSAADSTQSATITFDVVDMEENVQDTVCVEIIPVDDSDSIYYYSVMTAYPADIDE